MCGLEKLTAPHTQASTFLVDRHHQSALPTRVVTVVCHAPTQHIGPSELVRPGGGLVLGQAAGQAGRHPEHQHQARVFSWKRLCILPMGPGILTRPVPPGTLRTNAVASCQLVPPLRPVADTAWGAALGSGAEGRTLACFTSCCCPPCASRSARRSTWTPALGQSLAGGSGRRVAGTPVLWLAGLLSASAGGWLAFLERQGCGKFPPSCLAAPALHGTADGAPFSDSRAMASDAPGTALTGGLPTLHGAPAKRVVPRHWQPTWTGVVYGDGDEDSLTATGGMLRTSAWCLGCQTLAERCDRAEQTSQGGPQ